MTFSFFYRFISLTNLKFLIKNSNKIFSKKLFFLKVQKPNNLLIVAEIKNVTINFLSYNVKQFFFFFFNTEVSLIKK